MQINCDENYLILLMGLPRSGKSTEARKHSCPIVCPDAIRLAMHGQRFLASAESAVWEAAYLMARSLFFAGHKIVIVDATNNTVKSRDEWIARLGDIVANFKCIPINTPKEVCIERAAGTGRPELIPVIERMASKMDWSGIEGMADRFPELEAEGAE